MTLEFRESVEAIHARVFGRARAPRSLRIATDTRTLQRGDTFLALRGDRFDGHDYVAQAVAAGAAAVVIDRESARVPGVATLLVDDTLRAYMALAYVARLHILGDVVAVTGSTGKTTTKAFLEQLLEPNARVLASAENENNEIGVSKLLLAAEGDEEVLIVEMGARKYGDIAALVDVAIPDIGVLTNIGEAHLEIMGSRERIEETKWALFSRGAQAVLNASDEASRRLAAHLEREPHWFFADMQPSGLPLPCCAIVGDELLVLDEDGDGTQRALDIRFPGAHNRANLAAALACALLCGSSLDALVEIVPTLHLPPGRFERVALSGDVELIYDAYNASPSGTIASLDAFAQEPAERRIAVLGGMLELGEEAEALHERVGARAASCVQYVLAGGEFRSATARGAIAGGLSRDRAIEYDENRDAVRWLREHARSGDLVLLKGSRAYRLEEILADLRAS